jgi:hypothetical protein
LEEDSLQLQYDSDFDSEEDSLEIVASEDSWDPAMAKDSRIIEYRSFGPEVEGYCK